MKKLIMPILYGFLTLVVIELGLTLYLNSFATEAVFTQYASYKSLTNRYGGAKMTRHRYLGYALNPDYPFNTNRHNSLGFRGDDLASDSESYRIVCLGGSTTYGTGVEDYKKSYPYLLKQKLQQLNYDKVEVINAGVPGYGSLELLLNYRLLIKPLKPDLLIIYTGVNDIVARLVWPPEAFRADNSGYRSHRYPNQQIPLWEYSSLIRSILIKAGLTTPHNKLTQIDPVANTSIANEFFQGLREDLPLSGLLASPGPDAILAANDSRYFQENLTELIHLAKDQDTEVILSSFLFESDFYRGENNNLKQVLERAIEQSNELLKKISVEEELPFLDLAATSGLERAFYQEDGIHFTESGNDFRATTLAQYIITMPIEND
jgi:lysophospholipase L1-like esterase